MRATNGRHTTSNGLPYARVLAAFMLATLISTLFALPAFAAAGEIDFVIGASAPKVLPNATYTYTVTLTNNSGVDADTLQFDDTVTGGGTMTAAVPAGGVGGACSAPAANATTCTFTNLADTTAATVTVSVTAPATVGTVTNTVSAFTDTQADAAAGTLVANTPVENADLAVTKTHAPLSVNPGSPFTYTIAVKNNGPSAATGVSVADSAPTGVTFGAVTVSASDAVPYSCPAATASSLGPCVLGAIANGTTVTITINATLAITQTTGPVTNSVTVTSTSLDATTPNTAVDALTPAAIDLGVTLSVDPTTAAPGDSVVYTVTVQNLSTTDDATTVVVTDTLPAGLTIVTPLTAPAAGTAANVGNVWTWTIPTLVKNTSATATISATVDADAVEGTLTDSATVAAAQTDPTPDNNTASADLTITSMTADLNVVTAVSDYKPNQGDTIQLGIQVSNSGPADATNVVIKDVLPTGLQYVSCEPTPCEQSGIRRQSSQLFAIPLIPAGSAGTLLLNITVQASSGTLRNTASIVSADQADPTPANDSDSLSITIGGTNGNPGGSTGSSGGTGGTGGTTAFTGFTAGQLMPWFMLLASLGLVALEWARRMRLVSPIGSTYGFDPFQG